MTGAARRTRAAPVGVRGSAPDRCTASWPKLARAIAVRPVTAITAFARKRREELAKTLRLELQKSVAQTRPRLTSLSSVATRAFTEVIGTRCPLTDESDAQFYGAKRAPLRLRPGIDVRELPVPFCADPVVTVPTW